MSTDTFPVTVTIQNGAAVSSAAILNGAHLIGIQMPAAWTTANLTLLGSADGVTYQSIFDINGVEVIYVAAASIYIPVPPTMTSAIYGLEVRSGTSGSPVNQGALRTLQLLCKFYV